MVKWFAKVKSLATVVALLGSMSVPITPALASGTTLTGSNTVSAAFGQVINVTDLQISATAGSTQQVRLSVASGTLSMGTTTGLTFTSATSGAQLKFSGLLANVNTALATLHYTRTAAGVGNDTLEVSLVAGNQVYNPTNGHLYEYVTSDGAKTWTQAKALADARTSNGATGYLATLTSAEENGYVSDRLTGPGWMGASDAAVEGAWKWVDGPETGTQFWSGRAANYSTPGSPVNGQYSNWNSTEPNDAGGNEDCGQFLSGSGAQWNDLPCTVSTLAGYIVEYGAPGALPQIPSKNVTLSITGSSRNVSTCAQLQSLGNNTATRYDTLNLMNDIDCTGVNFTPLYPTDYFHGTFNGHHHRITNLTINQPGGGEVGLFSRLVDATVQDVTLASGSVTGDYYVGALAGEAGNNTTVNNVVSRLNVNATYYTGGLLGDIYIDVDGSHAVLSNSSSSGNVTTTSGYSGGLLGYISANSGTVTLSQVFATGNVTSGDEALGGLVGHIQSQTGGAAASVVIQDAYAQGNVTATGKTGLGGLVGEIYSTGSGSLLADVTINRTYASGTVNGHHAIGGLIGYNAAGGTLSTYHYANNFSAAHMVGVTSATTSGLIGQNLATSSYLTSAGNYYDATVSGAAQCAGQTALVGCTAVNASNAQPGYFKNNHTNAPLTAWNFSSIWIANASTYPTFALADDGDGITTAVENAGPNNGDANNDGEADASQANVSSFVDPVSGRYVAVQLSSACASSSAGAASEASKAAQDAGYDYPAGLVSFSADCSTSGYTATVTQYYYGITAAGLSARKYHAGTHGYGVIPGASVTQTTIAGQAVTVLSYQVTDGGALDEDGVVNGTIVDPSGLANSVVGVPNTGLGGRQR